MGFGFEKAEFFALFFETFFFGVFFTLCISTFIVLIRCPKDRRRNGFLQLVAGAMLVIAACHLIIAFICALRAYTDDPKGPVSYYSDAATSLDIAKGVLYALQTILGDLILLWRCYVVYDQRPISIVIPIVLLLGCFGKSSLFVSIPMQVVTPSLSHADPDFYVLLPPEDGGEPVHADKTLAGRRLRRVDPAIAWRIYRMARTAPYIQLVLLGLIESGALYTSTVLAFLCAFLARSPAYMIPLDMLPPVMGVCFCLIIDGQDMMGWPEDAIRWCLNFRAERPEAYKEQLRCKAQSTVSLDNTPSVGLIGPNQVALVAPTAEHPDATVHDEYPPLPCRHDSRQPAATSSHQSLSAKPVGNNTSTSLLARRQLASTFTLAAQNHGPADPSPSADPLAEYPAIHDDHSLAALDHIDTDQVDTWDKMPGPKLIARIFDSAKPPSTHPTMAAVLKTVIAEITCTPQVKVASPIGTYVTMADMRPSNTPNAFLIFNLPAEAVTQLLAKRVWSTSAITFQALPVNPGLPQYLFTLGGFNDGDEDEVISCICEHWTSEAANEFFAELIELFEETDYPIELEHIDKFRDSLRLEIVCTRIEHDVNLPCYNVYANPNVLPSDNQWYLIRNHFKAIEYKTHKGGIGSLTTHRPCSLCHSISHPRGMCPFPRFPGWQGPALYSTNAGRGRGNGHGGNMSRGAPRGGRRGGW
ncbi:hypothetical protein EWM64_g1480 [Hericium alpestre]|uniref:Uncharacterized protein n=1 Tax=Hericium alpestre TaxID=135208 RepID=A0A4Z0A7T0_9AGAM|nr:hypothetical protein EWM64_g1480 [Hericium alpestre]